jgi:hypothetical protein
LLVSVRGVLPAIAVAGIVSCVAVGCGSAKPAARPPASQRHRLSQKRFVAAADQICVASDRRVYTLAGSLSTRASSWQKTIQAADLALTRMAALRPPARDAAGFAHLLALGRRLRNNVQRVHDALARRNLQAARKAQHAATGYDTKEIHREAAKLGLTFCEQPQTNWPA